MTIRERRKELGLTQKQLAMLAETSAKSVCDWEKGRRQPNAKYARAIERVLGCEPGEIWPIKGGGIRQRREAMGLTQKQLAMLAGVPKIAIIEIEHEKRRISCKNAKRLSDVLGCAPEDLIDYDIHPLQLRRELAGLTRADVATALGISVRCLQSWEADEYAPTERRLCELAQLLACDPEDIRGTAVRVNEHDRTLPLAERYASTEERNRLVLENLWIVDSFVRKNMSMLRGYHADPEDFRQYLTERLICSIGNFKTGGSASLKTYLYRCLSCEIYVFIRKHRKHGMTGIPKDVRIQFSSVDVMLEAGWDIEG